MKVLVINPIMYTSETKNIKRAASIKDTMMYDFCLAFHEMGHAGWRRAVQADKK